MIDLRNMVEKYPECLEDSTKFKNYLKDLYPDQEDQVRIRILSDVMNCGIVNEIKSGKTDSISIAHYRTEMENKYGYSSRLVQECISKWISVFDQNASEQCKPIDEEKPIENSIIEDNAVIASNLALSEETPVSTADQRNKQHQNKNRVKWLIGILCLICLVVIVLLTYNFVMKPAKQYNTAVEQLNQGDYQQAIDSFESLDGYKDSADMVLQTKYKWAESLLADKAYDEAYAKFEEIKDYSDAADRMKDVRYTEAENNLMSKVQQEDSTEELPQVEEKTIDEAEKEPGVVMGKESTKGELTGVSPENGTTQAVPHEKVFPTAISISPNEITTRVLYTPTLAVTLSPENTTETDLTWTSSNTDVATVYASGLVLAGSVGETTITVTTVNGLTATCKVVVEESVFPDSIAMKEANVTMKVGETHAMEVLYTPKNTTMRGGTWESSNTAVATVDGKGVVSAVGEGTSVITHRMTWKSLSTSCNVIVSAPNNAANQVEKAPNSSKEIYSENDSVCISNNNPNWTAAEKAKVSPQFHGTWSRSYCDEGGEPVDTPYTWIIDLNEGVYERLNPDGSIDGWGYLIATSDPKELDADGVVAIGKLISDSEIFYRRIWPDSSWTDSTFKKISSVASVSGQLPVAKRGF